jgi:hypothetical protein
MAGIWFQKGLIPALLKQIEMKSERCEWLIAFIFIFPIRQ